MGILLLIIMLIVSVGINEGIEEYFVDCEDKDLVDCALSITDEEEEEPEEGTVVATGAYEYKGNTVNITMNIPLTGGSVTGSVSGTCEGNVKGTYVNGGSISGKMSGVCAPFFVNIPASADFSGSVNKAGKTVPISFNGTGGGFTHEGSTTLVYP